ncbi:hypothetical protein IMZ48_30250 [Candidatus Bathyarchaeota archaeon]|nr:hypothetical protein [Candidatus Bathyarchaeota archaeon]
MDSPPYSPPPEDPISPHPPLYPDDGDILDDLGPLDLSAVDTASTAVATPSGSHRGSVSTQATDITHPDEIAHDIAQESKAPQPREATQEMNSTQPGETTQDSDKGSSREAPTRAKGGRRRRTGGRRGERRESSLGTIVDVDDVTEAGTDVGSEDDVAREKRFVDVEKRAAVKRAAKERAAKERAAEEREAEEREAEEQEAEERYAEKNAAERKAAENGGGDEKGMRGGKHTIKKTIGDPVPIPRKPDGGTPKLQIGLDLEVELELKAKLLGDISLALV